MTPFARRPRPDAKIPRHARAHVPERRHEQLRSGLLLARTLQRLFVGRRSRTFHPRTVRGERTPTFPLPAPTGPGLQLASQALAQGGPQRRQPFPLCLVPSRVALAQRPLGKQRPHHFSRFPETRLQGLLRAPDHQDRHPKHAQRRPFRPHNAPAGKEGARQELPNGVFQAVAIGCLGPTLPARPAADVRTFLLRTSHASLRALAFCGRNT